MLASYIPLRETLHVYRHTEEMNAIVQRLGLTLPMWIAWLYERLFLFFLKAGSAEGPIFPQEARRKREIHIKL